MQNSNAELIQLRDGSMQIRVKLNQAQDTFLNLTEDKVAMLTHPAEAQARLRGGGTDLPKAKSIMRPCSLNLKQAKLD